MSNNDLLEWTKSEEDFYDFLGITFETFSLSELPSAFRKTRLKYHADKLRENYDPAKWELVNAANDVLSDPELKAKYDNHRQARVQRQRADELFEGKRRQMKEDLEARERGDVSGGAKRPREEDEALRRLAEEGRKRRAARESMMAESVASSPAPAPRWASPEEPPKPVNEHSAVQEGEDEVERLERLIRENKEAKAKRKADKKARKSGVFGPTDSPLVGEASRPADQDASTPKCPDIFRGLKAESQSSASPKFSFSPAIATPKNDFAATMARLKAAEKQRKDEIRRKESETA